MNLINDKVSYINIPIYSTFDYKEGLSFDEIFFCNSFNSPIDFLSISPSNSKLESSSQVYGML